jgi:hypothetical protein
MNAEEIRVASGAVIAFRLFDVAYEIDLVQAEAIWARQSRVASRSRLSATPPKAMEFGVAPLLLTLDPVPVAVGDRSLQASVSARLFDFGVVSFALRISADDLGWEDFVALVNAVDRSVGPQSGSRVWHDWLGQLTAVLGSALSRPVPSAHEEDYLVGLVREFSQDVTATELQSRIDLPALLSGETRKLSEGAQAELMRQRFSYYTDDLVVLTWDRAFIHEPRGDSDVMDVIEVANAQLLELRYYDEMLDAELPRMYDLVENARRTRASFAARRFANLARRLYTMVAEVTELTEKVDNALQVTEDVYLARIYGAALELFRVPMVEHAVSRKLSIMRDTYTALNDEASSRRGELMELLILLLIAAEVILAFTRH